MGKKRKRRPFVGVHHKQVWLKTRGHNVDIHVYPVMQMLWDAGIQTFFSCQGGPDKLYLYGGGKKIKSDRAMVVILKKDADRVCKILTHLNPTIEKWDNRYRRDHAAIKFDPSQEAQAARVTVQGE